MAKPTAEMAFVQQNRHFSPDGPEYQKGLAAARNKDQEAASSKFHAERAANAEAARVYAINHQEKHDIVTTGCCYHHDESDPSNNSNLCCCILS